MKANAVSITTAPPSIPLNKEFSDMPITVTTPITVIPMVANRNPTVYLISSDISIKASLVVIMPNIIPNAPPSTPKPATAPFTPNTPANTPPSIPPNTPPLDSPLSSRPNHRGRKNSSTTFSEPITSTGKTTRSHRAIMPYPYFSS
jgi:hypothetical protein